MRFTVLNYSMLAILILNTTYPQKIPQTYFQTLAHGSIMGQHITTQYLCNPMGALIKSSV